jgi:hypothetical protein
VRTISGCLDVTDRERISRRLPTLLVTFLVTLVLSRTER